MKPILFTIGSYNAYAFGMFLAISFILSTFIIWKFGKEELREEEYLDAFFSTSVVSLVSARITYILFHFSSFGGNILKYILVRQTPGLSLLGGMVSGFFFLWWYSKKNKLQFLKILDLFSLATCVSLIFAKIGEQFGGAGFGKETSAMLGIRIIGMTGRRHPVELYEAFGYLMLAIILFVVYHRIRYYKWPKGLVFHIFGCFLAVLVFGLEFFKVYPVYYYGLSQRQISAIVLFLVTAFALGRHIAQYIIKQRKKS